MATSLALTTLLPGGVTVWRLSPFGNFCLLPPPPLLALLRRRGTVAFAGRPATLLSSNIDFVYALEPSLPAFSSYSSRTRFTSSRRNLWQSATSICAPVVFPVTPLMPLALANLPLSSRRWQSNACASWSAGHSCGAFAPCGMLRSVRVD